MVVYLKKTPPYAPGANVAEMLRDAVRVAKISVAAQTSSPATVTVCRIPANTLVMGCLAETRTAMTSTGALTLTLGDTDLATALHSLASSDLSATGQLVSTFAMKHYVADQDVVAVLTNVSATTSSVGAVDFWIMYRTDDDEQLIG